MRVLVPVFIAVVAVSAGGGRAHAQPDTSLDRARAQKFNLQYREARATLERLEAEGGNPLSVTGEIYRLRGEIAAGLGDAAEARAYFLRWLLIDPDAGLSPGASPKLVEPFEAARKVLATDGGLRLGHSFDGVSGRLVVEVVSDPLSMVAGARAHVTAHGERDTIAVAGTDRIAVQLPGSGQVWLEIVDERGNAIATIGSPAQPLALHLARPPSPRARPPAGVMIDPPVASRGRPLYARWQTWSVLAGVAALGAGGFGIGVLRAEDQLDALNAASRERAIPRDEALAIEQRGQRYALAANASLAVAGALAVTAVVVALWPDDERPAVDVGLGPTSSGGPAVVLGGRF